MSGRAIAASFRDPSGFLFVRDGVLYRQVNRVYAEHYDRLQSSGLYEALTGEGLLIPHREHPAPAEDADAYRILEPEPVPFISYPYEWCFSQWRDAALVTLRLARRALEHGMTLKDASAYNVQFRRGRPVWIDTLSFETYVEGRPWVAYRQFCQHFLAPLVLMSWCDVRLGQLARVFLDGVPLELASRLLPWRTRLRLGMASHIHLHARVERRVERKSAAGAAPPAARALSRRALEGILASLEATVRKLAWRPEATVWSEYYEQTNYTPAALEHKARLVGEFLNETRPRRVWDLGANVGRFSRLASDRGMFTVAFDMDPAAVERNYRAARDAGDAHLLPLVLDLTNPSSALGWAHRERMSLAERGPADLVLALALVHHLAIGNNVPLERIAEYFAALGRALAIEWVPKEDSQVARLLTAREDIFAGYTREAFERAFAAHFTLVRAEPLRDSARVLYLFRRREAE